jgi:hypothetical protein
MVVLVLLLVDMPPKNTTPFIALRHSLYYEKSHRDKAENVKELNLV